MHQQTGPGNDQQGEAPQHHSVNSGEPAHSDSTFDPGEHVDVDPQNSTNLRDLTYLIKGARDVVANASGECAKLLGKDALEKFDRISKNIEFNGNVEVQDANPLTGEVERAPLQNLGWVQGETFGNNIYLNPEGTAFNFVHKGGSTQHILQGYFDKLGVTQEQYAFAVVIHEFLHAIKKFGPDATFVSDGNFWKLNGDKSVKNQEEVIRKCFSNKK
jgi:hypothetical protein